MKSKNDVEKRLRKLRLQYAKKHIAKSQARLHRNCVFNHEHVPTQAPPRGVRSDTMFVPSKQVTLVVIQPDAPVTLCMFGSKDPTTWLGDVCDKDEIAASCPMFKARTSPESARVEFLNLTSDDEYVFDNYRDVAALQWVLEDRTHRMPLRWWERLMLWFQAAMLVRRWRNPRTGAAALPAHEVPEDIWNEDAAAPPS